MPKRGFLAHIARAEYELPTAKSFGKSFCRICGASAPRLSRDGQRAKPTARGFWDSRAPWSCLGGDLPRFPESVS